MVHCVYNWLQGVATWGHVGHSPPRRNYLICYFCCYLFAMEPEICMCGTLQGKGQGRQPLHQHTTRQQNDSKTFPSHFQRLIAQRCLEGSPGLSMHHALPAPPASRSIQLVSP